MECVNRTTIWRWLKKLEAVGCLRVPSVQAFVRSMEQPRPSSRGERSILSLFGDGARLHRLTSEAASLPRLERVSFLRQHIQPYLQLVEGERRDPHTKLRLIDIWRYFRLTWSTPYRSTPGRNLFYLVRDAAEEGHPVVGIAALSNAVIGLRCRDDRIGWTPDALAEQLLAARRGDVETYRQTAWTVAALLERYLETGVAAISWGDITIANEVAYPSEDGIAALEAIAAEAMQARYDRLREERGVADMEDFRLEEPPDGSPIGAREDRASHHALFHRKRAQKLAALLRAKLLCQQKNVFTNAPEGLPRLLWNDAAWTRPSEAGRSALRTILLAQKDTKIGTSMMEITVCGAIAPYSYLLGGKLVAMLLTSPQVVQEYRARYGRQSSTIASQMAERDVTRDADLVLLGTSSLYAGRLDAKRFGEGGKDAKSAKMSPQFVSASQYNRLRLPAALFGSVGEVRYEHLGITSGYGVVHFSADTRKALERLDILASDGARRVNSVFGEGTSPRMRKIRQGISLLGLNDHFLIHGQARLVYGIRLARNTERYLMGLDPEPDYVFPQDVPEAATQTIAEYWVERWLASRVEHPETLDRLDRFEPKHHAVSREYGDPTPTANLTLRL